MNLIILAAGRGSRLMPFTTHKPKCLVEILGKSLLEYQLKIYENFNIKNIIVVGGYKNKSLIGNYKVVINHDYKNTNMVVSLFTAVEQLTGDVIITYGDVVHSPRIINLLLNFKGCIGIPVDLKWKKYWKKRFSDVLDDAETLKMANGKIFEIGKKPLSIKDIQAQYMGLIKLNNSGTTIFKKLYEEALMGRLIQGKHVSNAYMTDFLQEIIDSGFTVDAIQSNEDWIEIDSPEDLKLEITSNRLINIIQQTNLI